MLRCNRTGTRRPAGRARPLGATDEETTFTIGRINRFLLGADERPVVMADAEVATELNDPFATIFLRAGRFPNTADEIVAALDALDGPDALPGQLTFLASEGGQIPFTLETAGLARSFRLVIGRHRGDRHDLLISTGALGDRAGVFLQVVGWDETTRRFNYYQREPGPAWFWAGNSDHALVAPTRGKGPFDSHVNGALVMREFEFPWLNWHSSVATIDAALAPDDRFRDDPLFTSLAGAVRLEVEIVEPGIRRWTDSRLDRVVDGVLSDVPLLMRQVLTTTTVNLRTTETESASVTDSTQLRLPPSLFFDQVLLDGRLFELEVTLPAFLLSGSRYLDRVRAYDLHLSDGVGFRQDGDVHFAFLFAERAAEDTAVLAALIGRGWLAPKFAAALLMVDFPNPVFSARRARLLQYTPTDARVGQGTSDIADAFVAALEATAEASDPTSAEREFLDLWRTPDDAWQARFRAALEAYAAAVAARLDTDEGADAYFRLADSRRRQFRGELLREFPLLLPKSTIPQDGPPLRLARDGSVILSTGDE